MDTHGHSAVAEESSWSVYHSGSGAYFRPSSSSSQNWIHISIPTPVVLPIPVRPGHPAGLARWSALSAYLTCATNDAVVIGIHLWDGNVRIAEFDESWDPGPGSGTKEWDIPNSEVTPIEVQTGIGISIAVRFEAGNDPYIGINSAGFDFAPVYGQV